MLALPWRALALPMVHDCIVGARVLPYKYGHRNADACNSHAVHQLVVDVVASARCNTNLDGKVGLDDLTRERAHICLA
eukprot:676429-Lingulodinium_polyedra.AAC.1